MNDFEFPPAPGRKLDLLTPRQFITMAIHIGARIRNPEDIDKRYAELKNAWVLNDYPTHLPNAAPYFQWLEQTITAVVNQRNPPPKPAASSAPAPAEPPLLSPQALESIKRAAVEEHLAAKPPSDNAPPATAASSPDFEAILNTLNHGGMVSAEKLSQWLEQASAQARDSKNAADFSTALDQIKWDPSMPAAGVHTPEWTAAELHDELEALVFGNDGTQTVDFFSRAVACSAAVCKVVVHRYFNRYPDNDTSGQARTVAGTGWLIGPRLVITNHHVINARKQGFGQEPDASPVDFALQAQSCEILLDYFTDPCPTPFSATLLVSDRALDYAILRLEDAAPARSPLRLASHVLRKTQQQALGFGVNVLQHPNGRPMRIGFRNNYVLLGDDTLLTYLTDTDVGSSGSPVCDDTWQVVALHTGSRGVSDRGLIVNATLIRRENYGTPIQAILEKLKNQDSALHQEIVSAQAQFGQ